MRKKNIQGCAKGNGTLAHKKEHFPLIMWNYWQSIFELFLCTNDDFAQVIKTPVCHYPKGPWDLFPQIPPYIHKH
ncbi:hypothetical protein XELAEV_18016916mg [Xenopus laevis]|uniref:Uncharacterized protein n=1 Tax=Xenopus laevis TaxID=8355 RepID=A0A974DAK9_XENLA|nr:hypothetical protein XELAEV_18016916mg [Xenopus laevis]